MAGMNLATGTSTQEAKRDGADEIDGLKTKVIDIVDIQALDISTNAEETINHLVDLKTRLHNDTNKLEKGIETCQEQLTGCENGIKELQTRNEEIEANIASSQSLGGDG